MDLNFPSGQFVITAPLWFVADRNTLANTPERPLAVVTRQATDGSRVYALMFTDKDLAVRQVERMRHSDAVAVELPTMSALLTFLETIEGLGYERVGFDVEPHRRARIMPVAEFADYVREQAGQNPA